MDVIQRNWQDVQGRVRRAAESVGRDPAQITVVAVTKTRSAAEVAAALRAGVTDVGENRVQEAEAKRREVTLPARWHLIGSLQRNKAGRTVDTFDVVQSVDSLRLAEALERRARLAGRRLDILLQVNTAGAAQQGGVAPADLAALAAATLALDHLRVCGLMTIAAHVADTERVRACFRHLRQLAAQLRRHHGGMEVLSMGMSGDFELAIQEGATLVRIGTAIFGSRAPACSGT